MLSLSPAITALQWFTVQLWWRQLNTTHHPQCSRVWAQTERWPLPCSLCFLTSGHFLCEGPHQTSMFSHVGRPCWAGNVGECVLRESWIKGGIVGLCNWTGASHTSPTVVFNGLPLRLAVPRGAAWQGRGLAPVLQIHSLLACFRASWPADKGLAHHDVISVHFSIRLASCKSSSAHMSKLKPQDFGCRALADSNSGLLFPYRGLQVMFQPKNPICTASPCAVDQPRLIWCPRLVSFVFFTGTMILT